MVEYQHAVNILSEMVQIGRTFRVSHQRNTENSFTGTKFGLLQLLSREDARLSELALRMSISAPVASRAIDSLAADGFVERRCDPKDARAQLISITAMGRTRLSESESLAIQRFADALGHWSAEEAVQAATILHELNEHLKEVTSPPPHSPSL